MVNELQESAEFHIDDDKWVRVSSSEAAARFKSTVSCYMQLFRCPKCKQYLSFVNSENHLTIPYFRHPPGSADCPLKLDNENTGQVYIPYTYTRVKKSFEFPISIGDTNKRKLSIIIHFKDFDTNLKIKEPFPKSVFLVEEPGYPYFHYDFRFEGGLKFFKLSLPYKIRLGDLSSKHIDVIRKNGALFTASGTKVKYGRSPVIGETYLFLVPSSFAGQTFFDNFSLSKEKLLSKGTGWSLYKIKLTGTGSQANFIYDMGYNYPSIFRDLEPIWPPAVSDFNSNKIRYTFLQKNEAFIAELNEEGQPFIKLDCNTKYDPPEGFLISTNPQLFQKGETRYISDRDVLLQKDHSTSNGIEVVFTPHFDGFLRAYDLKNDCTLIPAFERKFCGNDKKQKFVLVNIPSTFLLKIFYSLDCVYCQAFRVSGAELKKFYEPKHISFPGKSEIKISSVSLKADKKREDKVSDQNEKKKEDKVKIKNGSTNVVLSAGHINSSDLLQSRGRLTFNGKTVFLNYIVNCNGKSFMLPIAFMKDAQLEPIYKDIRTTKFNEIYPYMLERNAVEHSKKFEMCSVECDSNSTFSYPFDETTRTHIKIERRPHLLTGFLKKQPYANIKEYEKRFKKLNREEQKKIFDEGAIFYAYFCNETEPNALFYKQNKSGLYYTQRFILHSKNIVEIIINGMPHLFYSPEKIFSGIKSRSKNYRFTNSKKSSPKRVKQ